MDLVEESIKEEGGKHVHGWENITLVEEEATVAHRLLAWFLLLFPIVMLSL